MNQRPSNYVLCVFLFLFFIFKDIMWKSSHSLVWWERVFTGWKIVSQKQDVEFCTPSWNKKSNLLYKRQNEIYVVLCLNVKPFRTSKPTWYQIFKKTELYLEKLKYFLSWQFLPDFWPYNLGVNDNGRDVTEVGFRILFLTKLFL